MNTIIANFQCAQPSHKESALVTQNILFCTLHQLLQASLLSCQPHQSKRTTTEGFWVRIIESLSRELFKSDAIQLSMSFLYALTLPGWYCLVVCAVTLRDTKKVQKPCLRVDFHCRVIFTYVRAFNLRVRKCSGNVRKAARKGKRFAGDTRTLPLFYLNAEMLRACRHN